MKKNQTISSEPWRQLIPPLHQLLVKGVCRVDDGDTKSFVREWLTQILKGVAAPEAAKDSSLCQWISAQPLLALRRQVASDNEAIAALLATVETVREPWLAIMGARVRESGQMKNPEPLFHLVTQLGGAASWVEESFPEAGLKATHSSDLERSLFGVVAESAQAVPILGRVLASAAWLKPFQQNPLPAIQAVDATGERPDLNWCKGRLLELPQTASDSSPNDHGRIAMEFLLSGGLNNQPDTESLKPLPWVLANPWAFLLTSLVYAQDSWDAEQQGGILLELPAGQHAFSPNQIQVLVVSNDGDEVLCGTLAGLVLKFLESRSIHLFPHTPKIAELDSLLKGVVKELLTHKVWRHYEGLSGQQGYFQIDPEFADLCYRRLGSKIFHRYGKSIWQGFRVLAEQWGMEARSGMGKLQTSRLQGAAV
jgi:hypothetical protein